MIVSDQIHIGVVTHHNYPTDIEVRITKFINLFCKEGFKTTVFCPNLNANKQKNFKDFFLCAKSNRELNFLQNLWNAPIPINPVWFFWLFKKFKNSYVNLIIVRDLRLFLPAYIAAKLLNKKIILDIGEHYPGMMEVLGKQKLIHYITRNVTLISILETFSVYLADSVWVVAKENMERLTNINNHIEVISNNPIDDSWKNYPSIRIKKYSLNEKPLQLISFGLIDNIRGLDFAIDLIDLIKEELPNVCLVIFGDGPYKRTLEQKSVQMNLQNKILFKGWISSSKKYHALAKGDLGIIFHKECKLTNHTIPNKIFDYMSMGIPVISTNLNPLKRIINKEKCGYIISNSKEKASKQIIEIIKDSDSRSKCSVNARKAMIDGYKWEHDEKKIINCIKELIPQQ